MLVYIDGWTDARDAMTHSEPASGRVVDEGLSRRLHHWVVVCYTDK